MELKDWSSKNYDHVTISLRTDPNYQSYTQISFILANNFNTKIIEVHMAKHIKSNVVYLTLNCAFISLVLQIEKLCFRFFSTKNILYNFKILFLIPDIIQ